MAITLSKTPDQCKSKEEIREQIDQLDKEILRLFSIRFQYVSEIVKYKQDAESVVAIDRKIKVINERGKWAEELGLDKETYSHIYEYLIDHNISKELEILNSKED